MLATEQVEISVIQSRDRLAVIVAECFSESLNTQMLIAFYKGLWSLLPCYILLVGPHKSASTKVGSLYLLGRRQLHLGFSDVLPRQSPYSSPPTYCKYKYADEIRVK